jgi:midasin
MAACWGLGADAAEYGDMLHKPALAAGSGAVAVGRAVLPAEEAAAAAVAAAAGTGAAGAGGGWARTGHAMRLLERVAAAVQMTEPVLLVGETGTGKTALVQQLAKITGAPLTVVNLSNQSESADFLGGFRPAGARHLCLPLLPRFRKVFEATFPNGANAEFMTRVARYAERRKWTHLLHAFRAGVERVAKLAAAEDAKSEDPDVDGDATAAVDAAAADPERAGTSGRGGEDDNNGGRGVGAKSKRKGAGGGKKGSKASAAAAAAAAAIAATASINATKTAATAMATETESEASGSRAPASKKRRRSLPDTLVAEWRSFERDLSTAERACGNGMDPHHNLTLSFNLQTLNIKP